MYNQRGGDERRKTIIAFLAVTGFIVFTGLSIFQWGISSYNDLATRQEQVQQARAGVAVDYQRRFDLIGQLVNVAEGALTQEQEVFGQIAIARAKYSSAPAGSPEQLEAVSELEGFFSRLLVIMEDYPELRSYQNITQLMDEIAGTENRIAYSRDNYNEIATDYNITIRRYPRSVFANWFGFEKVELFEVQTPDAERAPEVELNKNE